MFTFLFSIAYSLTSGYYAMYLKNGIKRKRLIKKHMGRVRPSADTRIFTRCASGIPWPENCGFHPPALRAARQYALSSRASFAGGFSRAQYSCFSEEKRMESAKLSILPVYPARAAYARTSS